MTDRLSSEVVRLTGTGTGTGGAGTGTGAGVGGVRREGYYDRIV